MENLYITKVSRFGNSLGVIIPIELLRGLEIQRGDSLVFTPISSGRFMAAHLDSEKIKELKQYLNNISDVILHD